MMHNDLSSCHTTWVVPHMLSQFCINNTLTLKFLIAVINQLKIYCSKALIIVIMIMIIFWPGKTPGGSKIRKRKLQNLFGIEPYSGRSSSTKPSCSKTELLLLLLLLGSFLLLKFLSAPVSDSALYWCHCSGCATNSDDDDTWYERCLLWLIDRLLTTHNNVFEHIWEYVVRKLFIYQFKVI